MVLLLLLAVLGLLEVSVLLRWVCCCGRTKATKPTVLFSSMGRVLPGPMPPAAAAEGEEEEGLAAREWVKVWVRLGPMMWWK